MHYQWTESGENFVGSSAKSGLASTPSGDRLSFGAMDWNYGNILDAVDAATPSDARALIHGEKLVTWGDFSQRSNRVARNLRDSGIQTGAKVGFYLRNCTEYTEALAACFKGRLVHVNVNFRYLDDELAYIVENSDATVMIFGAEFLDRVDRVRARLPKVAEWIQVGGQAPEWATSYEEWASKGDGAALGIERSGDDMLFIYTGGTTGMPKGVMWRQADLWGALRYGATMPCNGGEAPPDLETLIDNIRAFGTGGAQIPACPLMHGTGLFTAINAIACATAIVTLEASGFDPEELWSAVDAHKATSLVIVGDAFAKPMLDALDRNAGRWDISSVGLVVSSGVMWSRETKNGLLRHNPGMFLFDSFGSSEGVGFGSSITTSEGETTTARFQIGDQCKVFTEDHREVLPGSGEKGFIARSGPIPAGYYKDEEKTAKTFPVIDGVRYSIPGDWCTVEADGTLSLHGRGSACINSAGEKVFPEEVEEALKTHADVVDALVVGLPDDKWGQAVTAVVELRAGASFDEPQLRSWVRERLAGYKTPKRIAAVDKMFRAPNGKADYKSATAYLKGA